MMQEIIPNRVSIIIALYNGTAYIHRAIQSALDQTYRDVEIIVVDDCSTDDVGAALSRYAGRIRLIRHEKNQGISAARNTGVSHSSGEMVTFLDQDDWWPQDLLALLVPEVSQGTAVCYDNYFVPESELPTVDAEPLGVVRGEWKTVFEDKGWSLNCLSRQNMLAYFKDAPMLKAIVNRADFDAVGGYDARFNNVEDFHFCVKLLSHGVTLKIHDEPKGMYLVRPTSETILSRISGLRHVTQCARWSLLFRTIEEELSLDADVVAECRRRNRYWQSREALELLKLTLRNRSIRFVFQNRVLQRLLPRFPSLLLMKSGRLP